MSGEEKKRMKSVVCAGIAILALAGCARATLSNSSSIVENGLEYYIELDNAVYNLGESIVILCRVTNVGDQSLDVSELGIYTLSFELIRPEGDALFSPYYGPPFPPMPPGLPNIITLNPGEYMERRYDITSRRWGTDGEWVEEPFTTVGHYSISSKYENCGFGAEGPLRLEPDALDFAIIPEPSTLLLLGFGGLALLRRRRA